MTEARGCRKARGSLKADVLNQRVWEEPILFACERLARGDDVEQGDMRRRYTRRS